MGSLLSKEEPELPLIKEGIDWSLIVLLHRIIDRLIDIVILVSWPHWTTLELWLYSLFFTWEEIQSLPYLWRVRSKTSQFGIFRLVEACRSPIFRDAYVDSLY